MSERFHITLEHPGDHAAAVIALRLALKRLWRDHRLRCIEVSPGDSDAARAIQRQRTIDDEAADLPIVETTGERFES